LITVAGSEVEFCTIFGVKVRTPSRWASFFGVLVKFLYSGKMFVARWTFFWKHYKPICSSAARFSTKKKSTPWSRISHEIVSDPESKKAKRVTRRVQSAGQFIQILEKELTEASAGALGRSQRSLDRSYNALFEYRKNNKNDGQKRMMEHNELRKIALRKREDLLIHRQCCGFRLNNDTLVTKKYPIPLEWTNDSNGEKIKVSCLKSNLKSNKQNPLVERTKHPPPSNYICNRCMQPGHWRENCEN
jgi:hypothetical protein